MKKRLALAMVCVFVPLVLVMGSLLADRSFTLAMERETQRAALVQSLLMENLKQELATLSYAQLTQAVPRYHAAYAAQGIALIICHRGAPMGGAQLPNRYYDGLFTGTRCAMLDTRSRPEIYVIAEPVTQDLTLLTLRDVGDLYAQREEMGQTLLVYGLLGTLVVAGLSLLLAWLLTRPVAALQVAAQGVADGREPPPALPTARRDELGALARSFEMMREAVAGREEALREQAESRQRLLDALAHEMRTPLCAILGNTRLLQTATLTEEQRKERLESIATETKRLADMDTQLMKLTQVPHVELERHPLEVPALLRDCVQRLALPAEDGPSPRFLLSNPEGDAPVLMGDESLLALLLDNLAVNALRASEAGQTVILTALCNGFSVRDKGVGMTEEQLARAFEPFYKADKGRTRRAGGAGLGLSLCQRIAELHGGILTLESKPGEGTLATFTMENPHTTAFPDESIVDTASLTTPLQPVADSVTQNALSSGREVDQP